MKREARDPVDRFNERVDRSAGPDGCWVWTGSIGSHGYGEIGVDGRVVRAHRFAYQSSTGINPVGMVVCHRCDNPPCVNPAHLWIGTQAENMADMAAKDRVASGERSGKAKLTEDAVHEIRGAAGQATPTTELAARFGVSARTIRDVRQGLTWKRVH